MVIARLFQGLPSIVFFYLFWLRTVCFIFRPLSFNIFELDNLGGTRVLEEAQSTFDGNSKGISSNKCMTHRVVHFEKGDKVYLQVDRRNLNQISSDNVHEFGMFEIWHVTYICVMGYTAYQHDKGYIAPGKMV